jgi:hypothetical protein
MVSGGWVMAWLSWIAHRRASFKSEIQRVVINSLHHCGWSVIRIGVSFGMPGILPADYSEHSLGVDVLDGLHWIEQGPLVAHAVLRRRFGSSALRMDLRLQANRPWLELICSTHWSQRHELLRLTMPLARPAVRVAADTSGGVIERPASPITAREKCPLGVASDLMGGVPSSCPWRRPGGFARWTARGRLGR